MDRYDYEAFHCRIKFHKLTKMYKNTEIIPYTVYELAQYMAYKLVEIEDDEFNDE